MSHTKDSMYGDDIIDLQAIHPEIGDNIPLRPMGRSRSSDGVADPNPEVEEVDLMKKGQDEERGNWSSKCDFLLSLLGYAVGLSNIWRFPYLCYRNGGGAFLIPYWIFMFLCGVPLFFMETALGQFTSKSAVSIWSIVPIFKGTGYATIVITLIIACYYNVIMSYVVFFFISSFNLDALPWASCDNWWNTENCLDYSNQTMLDNYHTYRAFEATGDGNWSNLNLSHPGAEFEESFNRTLTSPSDEFFHHRVLQISTGLNDPGGMRWELILCLIPVWGITGLCLIKGVKSVGKVVYFTATFPYIILTVLLIRGLTLPGAWEGIRFYVVPKWEQLMKPGPWCDAAFQVFFSLGPGWGGIITMSSYNKFSNDCYKDGRVVPVLMGLTSFYAGFVVFATVGFMSHIVGRPIEEVVEHGPGLAFIMYPEVVAKLPCSQLWSALFFFMLFTVGLDTMFVMIETSITTVWDELPPKYRIDRRWILLGTIISMFFMGLPCVTRGGMYLFQLIDTYSSTYTVIAVCMFEALSVFWIYGTERFIDDVAFMIGYRPNVWFWTLFWKYISFGGVLGICVAAIVRHAPLTEYYGYQYPGWSITMGWMFCFVSIAWIPGWAIGRYIYAPGNTVAEKLKDCFTPTHEFGPASKELRDEWLAYKKVINSQPEKQKPSSSSFKGVFRRFRRGTPLSKEFDQNASNGDTDRIFTHA